MSAQKQKSQSDIVFAPIGKTLEIIKIQNNPKFYHKYEYFTN